MCIIKFAHQWAGKIGQRDDSERVDEACLRLMSQNLIMKGVCSLPQPLYVPTRLRPFNSYYILKNSHTNQIFHLTFVEDNYWIV